MTSSGVPSSLPPTGEAEVQSRPVKPVAADVSSGSLNSSKSKVTAPASLSSTKPVKKTGAFTRLNNAAVSKFSSAAKGKSVVPDNVVEVMTFKDVSFEPHDGEIRFRLIHFWEAKNPRSKLIIGVEMPLIDEEENVIQGFIPQGRMETYLRHMRAGATYRLNKFFGSKSKIMYRVADPSVTVSFSWNSVLSDLTDSDVHFAEDRFRIQGHKEFAAACDKGEDLYDYVGHIKVINGQVPNGKFFLDEEETAQSCRVELHVQTHDEPVMKMYLWDNAAFQFCEKFKASGGTASVILVTTLNPKRFGGVLSLCSMTSSRVFVDNDIQETRLYLSWLESNMEVANRVNATVVTKPETVFLGELFTYMKKASAKVAWFECTATIDDVVHGSGWYYIGCGVCHIKAIKGPTTLYLAKLSVYDHQDQAVFQVLGDAGEELTGKKAAELVESYFQANEIDEENHIVPVPQALIGTIGHTRRFIVKVSTHNLTGQTQTLTVTKVLLLEAHGPEANIGNNADEERGNEMDDNAAEPVKRGADGIESEGSKRAKCG